MNGLLQQLLLVAGLLQERRGHHACIWTGNQGAGLLFDFKLLLSCQLNCHPFTEIHSVWGAVPPCCPMKCPKCSSSVLRAPRTNNMLDDQVVRRRACVDCGHKWYTVEIAVPDYAVGWSVDHMHKPVLRVPLELSTGHTKLHIHAVEERDRWGRNGM